MRKTPFIFWLLFCACVQAGAQNLLQNLAQEKEQSNAQNFSGDSLVIEGQEVKKTDDEIQVKADRQDKSPLDYENLFSKPKVAWSNISNAKSGFFIGANGTLAPVIQTDSRTPAEFRAIYPYGSGYGFKAGLSYFSNPFIGFRIYAEYDEFKSSAKFKGDFGDERDYKLDYILSGVNVIFDTNLGQNYKHMIGVIVDIAYALSVDFKSNWNMRNASGQIVSGRYEFEGSNIFSLGLGMRYVLHNKHQFELIMRRFTNIRQDNTSQVDANNTTPVIFSQVTTLTIGYAYVF